MCTGNGCKLHCLLYMLLGKVAKISFSLPPTHPAVNVSIRDRASPHLGVKMQVLMWRCLRGLAALDGETAELGLLCISGISGIALHAALQPCMLALAKGLEQSLIPRDSMY